MRTQVECALLVVALTGCGGDGASRVEITGKPAAEAATTAARAVCRHAAACGAVENSCSGDSSGSAPTCSATIGPVDYQGCFDDAHDDLQDFLACPDLTASDRELVEDCVNALIAVPCPTQADVDATVRRAEMALPPPPPQRPAACAVLEQLPDGCG